MNTCALSARNRCEPSAHEVNPSLTPQVASTGTPFAIVVWRDVAPSARLKVNHDASTPWMREGGARWFYVITPVPDEDQNKAAAVARSHAVVRSEDATSGSAAGCAIRYLVSRKAMKSGVRLHLRQRLAIGCASLFLCAGLHARVARVRVADSTVFVAKGLLFLP
jgi:predicted PhzF superfamily epimerase YddE/YHI9